MVDEAGHGAVKLPVYFVAGVVTEVMRGGVVEFVEREEVYVFVGAVEGGGFAAGVGGRGG